MGQVVGPERGTLGPEHAGVVRRLGEGPAGVVVGTSERPGELGRLVEEELAGRTDPKAHGRTDRMARGRTDRMVGCRPGPEVRRLEQEPEPERGGLVAEGRIVGVRRMAMVVAVVELVEEVHRLEPELEQVVRKLDAVEVHKLEVVRVPVVRKLGVAAEDRTAVSAEVRNSVAEVRKRDVVEVPFHLHRRQTDLQGVPRDRTARQVRRGRLLLRRPCPFRRTANPVWPGSTPRGRGEL